MNRTFEHALGCVMRASRKAAGLTVRQVADSMNASVYAIEQMESGKRIPDTHDREAYANAVGATEGELLKRAWSTHDLVASIKPLSTVSR